MSDSSGNDYYYLHDKCIEQSEIPTPWDNPAALVEDSGTVVERYEYDAYGACRVLEPNFAPDPDGLSDYANPYLFTGRRLDILDADSLKIQYNRNRYYDPQTGRWLTHDPLGIAPNPPKPNVFDVLGQNEDGMNMYEYVNSWPVSLLDSYGLYTPFPPEYIIPNPMNEAKKKCTAWIQKELKDIGWLAKLPDCPRKIRKIGRKWVSPDPKKWTKPKKASQTYHKGAEVCMRSKGNKGGAGQQCCYNDKGTLMTRGLAAGTPDRVGPERPIDRVRHYYVEVSTFKNCTKYLGPL